MPWGMIISLSLGGNCLNAWDCADEKHAIHLSIPFKFIFLMRGDIIHGGALENSKKGVLLIHFYLLPAIKQRNGHTVTKLKWQDNNIHTDGSICGSNQNLLSFLLQLDGRGWSNLWSSSTIYAHTSKCTFKVYLPFLTTSWRLKISSSRRGSICFNNRVPGTKVGGYTGPVCTALGRCAVLRY